MHQLGVPTDGQFIGFVGEITPLVNRIDRPIAPLQLPELPLEPLLILGLHLLDQVQPPQYDVLVRVQVYVPLLHFPVGAVVGVAGLQLGELGVRRVLIDGLACH